ncbi:hypothetical protein CAP42_05830 [Acinetobacter indicus]|uniref:copper resistance protein NlpE N-terminal domain-containing protein n=1 Tax=Acinetobacter indicus TaxID=756892 RepID=UPI0005F895BB|nr:copper resistance protein NlpE N-terminal domain-containing protein [Acinetobacter indicus]KJV45044.1 hypothetical protein VH96_05105 [Acinetobacter indicus]OUY10520.1 hypothetical protein CAP42_05830 [Acinetobacter indicus]
MKKVILIPLVASSVLLGCQDQNSTQSQTVVESKTAIPAWVGEFKGTTPCMGCLSRCDDCPGMAVSLELHQDETYTLVRESMSGHNAPEVIQGTIRFADASRQQLELLQVNTRNLLYVDLEKQLLEIRVDQTGKRYQMQSDFILAKSV